MRSSIIMSALPVSLLTVIVAACETAPQPAAVPAPQSTSVTAESNTTATQATAVPSSENIGEADEDVSWWDCKWSNYGGQYKTCRGGSCSGVPAKGTYCKGGSLFYCDEHGNPIKQGCTSTGGCTVLENGKDDPCN